jgi:hypothetical protein
MIDGNHPSSARNCPGPPHDRDFAGLTWMTLANCQLAARIAIRLLPAERGPYSQAHVPLLAFGEAQGRSVLQDGHSPNMGSGGKHGRERYVSEPLRAWPTRRKMVLAFRCHVASMLRNIRSVPGNLSSG